MLSHYSGSDAKTCSRSFARTMQTTLSGLLVGLASTACILGLPLEALTQPATLTSRYPNSRIKIRSQPSTQSFSPNYGFAGDPVEVLKSTQGTDGYTWYYVRFKAANVNGWVRGDLLKVSPSATTTPSNKSNDQPGFLRTPVPPPKVGPTGGPTSPSIQAVVLPAPVTPPMPTSTRRYTDQEISYFTEIALQSEYGVTNSQVRKWNGPVRIKVIGSPTAADRQALQAIIAELNRLAPAISIEVTDQNANVDLYFVPESQFRRYEPNYQPTNLGFFWTWGNGNTIDRARILISTTGVTQAERSHLLREELTQALGLMQDSWRDPKSIFYQGWTATNEYTDLDRAVIEILYRPEIKAGMTRSQVLSVLQPQRLQNARQ